MFPGQKFEKWIVKSDSCDISAGKSTNCDASKGSSAVESESGVVNCDSNAVEIDSSEICVSPKPTKATEPAAGGSAKQTMSKSESTPQEMKRKRSLERGKQKIKLF